MSDCNHPVLTPIEGPLHRGSKDYVCECGQQFRVEKLVIGVSYGYPPQSNKGENMTLYGIVNAAGELRSTGLNGVPDPFYKTLADAESAIAGLGTPAGLWKAAKIELAVQ